MCPPGQTAESARTDADGIRPVPQASENVRAPRARAFSPTRPDPAPSQHATSTDDVLAAAITRLGDRGITNPSSFAALGAEAIEGTIRWFDAQNGRVGPGVLVAELRAGGKPGWRAQGTVASLQRQRDYADRVCAWLDRHFPDLERHPAAVAAVIRLHHLEGKGSLTAGVHGPVIRAAVEAWNVRWGDERKAA